MVIQIYKIRSDIWVAPSPEIWRPNDVKISARFRTTSRIDRAYRRNATRHRQSENGVANYGHSRTGKLNSVYFGQPAAKNRTVVLTDPTGGHQAGYCRASSFCYIMPYFVLYDGKVRLKTLQELLIWLRSQSCQRSRKY